MSGDVAGPPWVLTSPGGLRAVLVDGGAPASLTVGTLELVQHAASPFEAGLLQVWLRDRGTGRAWPLLGAGSGGRVRIDGCSAVLSGQVADADLAWRVTLTLDEERAAWAWHVEVRNDGAAGHEVDLVHAHDVALAGAGALRANELYVSQYLDLRPLGRSPALAVRQNLPQSGRQPWCVIAATAPVVGWATDLLDVLGWSARSGREPGPAVDLPSRRRQHEHTLATLQTERVTLGPGQVHRVSFAGLMVDDHPAATSDADLALAEEARRLARASAPWSAARASGSVWPHGGPGGADQRESEVLDEGRRAPSGLYDPGRELGTRPLTHDEMHERWPGRWRAVEEGDGQLLSFFTVDDEHVVTQAKELATLRPHGTILRTGASAVPDAHGLTSTAWMAGSPLSYLTRGHASAGRVLTTVRGYLGLHRAYGVRVFVDVGDRWRLLALPSTFAMTLDGAHWVYAFGDGDGDADGDGTVEIRTSAPAHEHLLRLEVRTTAGPERRVLFALHLATDEDPLPAGRAVLLHESDHGVAFDLTLGADDLRLSVASTSPVELGDGGALFDDGQARDRGTVTLLASGGVNLDLRVESRSEVLPHGTPGSRVSAGSPAATDEPGWWSQMTALRVADGPDTEPLAVSLPWLVRDALVHYLSPRGLEQYTGGAWGTRDVTQGPLELLLALDRAADMRALLLTVFGAQNPDGTWPQAFGFLPGDEGFRQEPSHGDVVHWPVLALGRYLLASGDASLLEEQVPWYAEPRSPEPQTTTLRSHLVRALDRARRDVVPGTRLVAYGHGDWNDSLQPADPTMAGSMASTWTVALHHQALTTLAEGLRTAGADEDVVGALHREADAVAVDLRRHLLVDGELAGYALLDPPVAGKPGAEAPDGDQPPRVRRLLVHPRDDETGLHHGALQMIQALTADLLDAEQAAHHVALVREHLMGVDGVRLFDRPPAYHGGTMRHFQRAETATFVGREIGLMYVHAHLRWCEAMARHGDAEALWAGVLQVLPAAAAAVPGARPRQANTYPSSSDAACLDREDFAARYAQVLTGETGLEAGWRIYSSGPGVLVAVVARSVLGVRRRAGTVEIDPVLPARLDGLRATVPLDGGLLQVRYRVGPRGYGPAALRLDGRVLRTTRTPNPYRSGGLAVELADLRDALTARGQELEVEVP